MVFYLVVNIFQKWDIGSEERSASVADRVELRRVCHVFRYIAWNRQVRLQRLAPVCAVTVIACGIIAYYQRSALLLLLSLITVMTEQTTQPPKAPTYNELVTLVEQLRKQVVETTVSSDANAGITDVSVFSEASSRQPALDFRVLPFSIKPLVFLMVVSRLMRPRIG